MPANLFYGAGIPACIIVIDNQDAQARKGIFMVDASTGYMKDGPKNRLRAQDIHKIVDTFTRRMEIPKYSRMVGLEEIEKNEFNLNLPRYIDSQEPEDIQDIEGHLQGGIPQADVDALHGYWAICPTLRQTLFKEHRPGYLALAVEKSAIKPAIYEHREFAAFITGMNTHFDQWRQNCSGNAKHPHGSGNAKHQLGNLKSLRPGCHPKEVIADLSEGLLAHYLGKPLIDQYDVYQHMMDYWAETLQDDCYLIAADGWKAETYRIVEKDKKGKEKDKGWTCDLVPKALIVARYFAKEQEAIDQLAAELESIAAKITELEEEHSGEDAPFSGFDKINKASIAARLKEVRAEIEELKPGEGEWVMEEKRVLEEWLKLNDQEAGLKKRIKEAEAELDKRAYAQYPKLTEDEIKTLVVDDKWLAALDAMIHGEMDRISQMLTQRVKELAELYETPMPQLSSRAADREAKVYRHLEKMGFSFLDDSAGFTPSSVIAGEKGSVAATLALLQSPEFRKLPKSDAAEIEQRIQSLRDDWGDD